MLSLMAPATEVPDDEADTGGEPDGAETRRSGPVYPADMLPQTLITRGDVNLMRVYEIDFDHPPKVAISADTNRAMLEKYGTNDLVPASQTERTALFRADPLEVVRLMSRETTSLSEIADKTRDHSLNIRTIYLGSADTEGIDG